LKKRGTPTTHPPFLGGEPQFFRVKPESRIRRKKTGTTFTGLDVSGKREKTSTRSSYGNEEPRSKEYRCNATQKKSSSNPRTKGEVGKNSDMAKEGLVKIRTRYRESKR